MTEPDPAATNPGLYTVVFENDEVRVLEYRDKPGDRTTPHAHPDSVMYSLTPFRRRLRSAGLERDVELAAGQVSWLPAQVHSGENIGDTDTHVLFVELKVGSHERLPREHEFLPEVELGPHGV
ncbi:cytoplasmic protein [Pedococcus sp.]|uniref:cytoplasmic protein n=1 Tax=Pedococcus sp. TaxID=2860345 RepID=UPI002E127884|nr:cytoplasmic protein [Pedococcus sp.]